MLVTGGRGRGREVLDSVELLNMDGTLNCPMPSMPEPRFAHTQSGRIICGGENSAARKSCVTFINGSVNWEKTHTLAKTRYRHSAWASPQGVILIGGADGSDGKGKTTEILTEDGDTKPGFTLPAAAG